MAPLCFTVAPARKNGSERLRRLGAERADGAFLAALCKSRWARFGRRTQVSGLHWKLTCISTHENVSEAPNSLLREEDLQSGPLTTEHQRHIQGVPPVHPRMRANFENMIRAAQNSICLALENVDGSGKKFREDAWVRGADGGGGISRVLQDGHVFEKAGVNVSIVYGTMPPEALQAASAGAVARNAGYARDERVPFFAAGISSVIHPWNPHVPTMHFNYRYFETDKGMWWMGGGTDLTPSYLYVEDAQHFHGVLKSVCDRHDAAFYQRFKKWCDDYFLIRHRGERRGIGGVFFDDLNDRPAEELFKFSSDMVGHVVEAYVPIVERRKHMPYTEEQKRWQQLRRGRYVEFNLVYDRGTVFGLKTGGRIESILMSLPLTARWEYDHQPAEGTPEWDLLDACRHPREWV
ncbi:coproporphyrinogen III oxidase [Cyanidioschyzon merolae strain 10D]|jgi:coproporphyrinogen III oxidase|uniref:coproporphyrinogen oxidase n=1 Tax=Cyanidioschyzon merolae (strain NIES-3377 / 10D) TaxID=280699 RepID=M1V5Z0_CYAM1|nr:coproporphyrinogen III oxidase [Cyanidioschyzon merolae strain 10D]BAM81505.1 coproporphyrinogen III oxidase [Cyanidioschyzon merolae strain 10D]|eukprot:XP_005537541.1 coproporphyrinogen III oxidase [Cyanidioschyzon merolae strain 10D]